MNGASHQQRAFAEHVVRRLREAHFTAYFAGGCVRDHLLGRTPTDYDVATSATPTEIRSLFGHRRTLAVGAAFGVITVLGRKPAAPVEVATFRRDAQYTDGRHPDAVTFSSAEEDARRRDFTINGLFYDPTAGQVIDYVGGRADLERRRLRAIGNPRERFAEDKLRLLRAVRFAAALRFELEPETARAVSEMAGQIGVVSPERIAMEMRRLLTAEGRTTGIRLLLDTGLAGPVLPEIVPACGHGAPAAVRAQLEENLDVLDRLIEPGFPLALAAVLKGLAGGSGVRAVGQRWRLSRSEIDRAVWLGEQLPLLQRASSAPYSELQPVLIHDGIGDLLALGEAVGPGSAAVAHCLAALQRPRETLDPPPLVDGAALIARGLRPGPIFGQLLARARRAQLDGEVTTREQALALLEREMEAM